MLKTDVRSLTKCIPVHPLNKHKQARQPRIQPPLQGEVGKCTTRGSLRKPSGSPEESPLGLHTGKAGGMPGWVGSAPKWLKDGQRVYGGTTGQMEPGLEGLQARPRLRARPGRPRKYRDVLEPTLLC